jgi:hypothetical protein
MSKVEKMMMAIIGMIAPEARIVEKFVLGNEDNGLVSVIAAIAKCHVELAMSYRQQRFILGFSVKEEMGTGKKLVEGKISTSEDGFYSITVESSGSRIIDMEVGDGLLIPWFTIGNEIEKAINK